MGGFWGIIEKPLVQDWDSTPDAWTPNAPKLKVRLK